MPGGTVLFMTTTRLPLHLSFTQRTAASTCPSSGAQLSPAGVPTAMIATAPKSLSTSSQCWNRMLPALSTDSSRSAKPGSCPPYTPELRVRP